MIVGLCVIVVVDVLNDLCVCVLCGIIGGESVKGHLPGGGGWKRREGFDFPPRERRPLLPRWWWWWW